MPSATATTCASVVKLHWKLCRMEITVEHLQLADFKARVTSVLNHNLSVIRPIVTGEAWPPVEPDDHVIRLWRNDLQELGFSARAIQYPSAFNLVIKDQGSFHKCILNEREANFINLLFG